MMETWRDTDWLRTAEFAPSMLEECLAGLPRVPTLSEAVEGHL
jgi:hypothetical protein